MSSLSSRPMILRSPENGTFLRINPAFASAMGLTREQLAEAPLLEWIHPQDRPCFEQWMASEQGCIRARHRTGDGDWRCIEWRVRTHGDQRIALGLPRSEQGVKPRIPELGIPLEHSTLTGTLNEMTRIVESKSKGLRCSILLVDKDKARVLVGAGPSLPQEYNEAVHGLHIGPTVGSCGTAAYWNVPVVVEDIEQDPLWKDLLPAAALAGVKSCWSVPITASDHGEVLGAMALYNHKPRAPKSGEMETLEMAARMVGLAIERDRLEEQLRHATTVRAVGVLAGGIAHDFNNLLATVMGNAELAMARLGKDSSVYSNLKEIVSAGAIATGLCNQMLNYAGRSARTTENVECNVLVKEIADLLQVSVSKKIAIDLDMSDEALGAIADRAQLRQVVMNLITNAADSIGNATGRVSVRTRAKSRTKEELQRFHPNEPLGSGEYVEIQVEDTGGGMSAETQAKIFEPFFTTKPTGRGLGLASVQGILRSHGGTISVKSELGKGTTFTVLLPRISPPAEPASEVSRIRAKASGERVLVVDDERAVRQMLTSMLETGGYGVVTAAGGKEAIEVFRRDADSIDCVLLDLSMPDLDGGEVFEQLRSIRDDVRVILISGFAEKEMLDRFRNAGLAGVLHKPAHMNVLLDKIEAALRTPVAATAST